MTLLDVVLFLPLAGFLLLLILPKESSRMAALVISLAIFIVSLGLLMPYWFQYPSGHTFTTDIPWISYPPIRYHVALDGLSLWLVLLSTLLTPIAVLVSWNYIDKRVKEFLRLPAAARIRRDRRVRGDGPVPVLRVLGSVAGPDVFPDRHLGTRAAHLRGRQVFPVHHGRIGADAGGDHLSLQSHRHVRLRPDPGHDPDRKPGVRAQRTELLLFLAFFIAFAIKVPLFPLHTWLPDAHVEAPTAGSLMLASVMLKMGTYGLLRFCLPLFPDAAHRCAPWIAGAGDHRHHLRRAGRAGAAEHEEAGGVFLGEPPGIRRAGNFLVHAAGPGRRGVPDAEPRHLDRSALHPGRLSV